MREPETPETPETPESPEPKIRRPITRDIYAILVALSAGAQTGSEVQSQIIGDTVGLYVRASSLYTTLHRLEEIGLIESRNKSYQLTDRGWRALKMETQTLDLLVGSAKQRVIIAGHGRW